MCSLHSKGSDSSPSFSTQIASGEYGSEMHPSFSHTHREAAKLQHVQRMAIGIAKGIGHHGDFQLLKTRSSHFNKG